MDASFYQKQIAGLEKENRILKQKLVRSESEREMLEEVLETHSNALKARNTELEESHRMLLKSEARYRELAQHDILTGLPNRFFLFDQLRHNFPLCRRSGYGALLYLDLDHFKDINDTFGHDIGDIVLCQAAKRLLSCVKREDTVSRIGGDEFAILLPLIQVYSEIISVADRIIFEIIKPFYIESVLLQLGVSIGISVYPNDDSDPERLLQKADMAMYNVKKSETGGYRFYHDIA